MPPSSSSEDLSGDLHEGAPHGGDHGTAEGIDDESDDVDEQDDDSLDDEEQDGSGHGSPTGQSTSSASERGWANLKLAQESVRMARTNWRAEEESARLVVARRASVRNLMAAVIAVIAVKVVAGSRQFFATHEELSRSAPSPEFHSVLAGIFVATALLSTLLFIASIYWMFGFTNDTTKLQWPLSAGEWRSPVRTERRRMLASALLYVPSLDTCKDVDRVNNHRRAIDAGDIEPEHFDGLNPGELGTPNELLELIYWYTMAAAARLHSTNKRSWLRVGRAQNCLVWALFVAVLGAACALCAYVLDLG